MTLIAYTYDIQPGTPEDITQVMANFNTVKAIVNGQLDNANIAAAAGILASKFAGYPNDVSKVLRGDGSWQAAGGVADSYGTTLPATPSSGDRAILVDSITNPTYQWLFRYNAGSSSSFKWECIGGIPKSVEITPSQGTTSTTYVDLATVGPTFTLPRAGDYLIATGAQMDTGNPDINGAYMSYAIGGAAATNADAVTAGPGAANCTVYRRALKTGLTAVAITCKYRATEGMTAATFQRRILEIMPVRV